MWAVTAFVGGASHAELMLRQEIGMNIAQRTLNIWNIKHFEVLGFLNNFLFVKHIYMSIICEMV